MYNPLYHYTLHGGPPWFCYGSVILSLNKFISTEKMPKANLTLEDIEQNKKSKDNLSASEVQRKYNIGWGRLQKLWNDKPVAQDAENITKQELTVPAQQDLSPVTQQENIQREIEHVTTQHKEIVVEDVCKTWAVRGKDGETNNTDGETNRINAKYIRFFGSCVRVRYTSILAKENKESHTLQDIERSVQEYTDFTKTLVYFVITGFAVWQVLCNTWKHIDKGTSPVSTVSTAPVPINPTKPIRPSLFKKKPDVFDL